MTKARNEQVSLADTSFYHCMVRCVRRAYLCGVDKETGDNFDHRKQWLVSRLRFLSYVYAIDICAYAVMSNHYHVVLHVDEERAQGWSDEEVVERWMQLYKGDLLMQRWWSERALLSPAELKRAELVIGEWRERLCSISWFMRGVNETIARMANEEDGCKGRFWEGRFKSQALLDEGALLTCMAYVDLNLVRAAMVEDLVESDFTSIQSRLQDYAKRKRSRNSTDNKLLQKSHQQQMIKTQLKLDDLPEAPLMAFGGSSHHSIHRALPFTREDYFDLVDSTGRSVREDKRGTISARSCRLIHRLGIDPDRWLEHVRGFGKNYSECAGSGDAMRSYASNFRRRWSKGVRVSAEAYQKAG